MSMLPLTLFASLGGFHPAAVSYQCHVTSPSLAVDGDASTWAINRKKNALSVCQAAHVCPPGFVTRDDGACTLPDDDEIGISSYMMVKNGAPCDEFLGLQVSVSRPQTCTGNRCATPVVTWVLGGHFTPGPTFLSPGTWQWELIDAVAVGRGDLETLDYVVLENGASAGYDQVLLGREFTEPTGAYQDSRWNVDLICSL